MSSGVTNSSSSDCVVLRGAAAGLSLLRATAGQPLTSTTALTQSLDVANNERVLYGPMSVQVNIVEPSLEEDDENNNNNNDDDSSSPAGYVVVSSERLLFWTTSTDHECYDLIVPGICIELHAMTDDPKNAVYVQIRLELSDLPLELTIVPVDDEDNNCNALFQALSELISLHPIDPNQDSDEAFGGMMSMMMTMMGSGGGSNNLGANDDDDANDDDGDDELVCAAPSVDGVATEEERQAMLDRLDNLLIVPPELEQEEENGNHEHNQHVEGQFDNAEDDDDDDDIL